MSEPHAIVVDDNDANLLVLTTLLKRQGVICTEVSDPRQMSTRLEGIESIDVAFVDLEMPNLNGYQVKDMLRARYGQIPIVAYTVHSSHVKATQEMGFDGFIGKPLDQSRFPDQLARILRGEGVWEWA